MFIIRFRADPPSCNALTVKVDEICPPGHPTAGDVRFALSLRFGNELNQNFYARTHAWVSSRELANFARDLNELERTRRGSATLNSMSPGELVLTVASADSSGHPVVRGQTGRHIFVNAKDEPLWCCLPFAIPFDAGVLPTFARDVALLARGRS